MQYSSAELYTLGKHLVQSMMIITAHTDTVIANEFKINRALAVCLFASLIIYDLFTIYILHIEHTFDGPALSWYLFLVHCPQVDVCVQVYFSSSSDIQLFFFISGILYHLEITTSAMWCKCTGCTLHRSAAVRPWDFYTHTQLRSLLFSTIRLKLIFDLLTDEYNTIKWCKHQRRKWIIKNENNWRFIDSRVKEINESNSANYRFVEINSWNLCQSGLLLWIIKQIHAIQIEEITLISFPSLRCTFHSSEYRAIMQIIFCEWRPASLLVIHMN